MTEEREATAGPCRWGCMVWSQNDDPIGVALELYGEWAQKELDVIERVVGPGDVVLDVGAFIGTHTIALAQMVSPDGHVTAFEPQAWAFEFLAQNVQMNQLDNVHLHRAVVSDTAGMQHYNPPDYEAHGNFGAVTFAADGGTTSVPALRLDDVVNGRVDFVKIDAEGMELSVLRGMEQLLLEHRPLVLAEANSLEAAAPVFSWFGERGYRALFMQTPAFNPDNFRDNEENVFGVACESSVLYVPGDRFEHGASLCEDLEYVFPVTSLDELAERLLATPRYGDESPFDRDPAHLLERVRELGDVNASLAASLDEATRLRDDMASQLASLTLAVNRHQDELRGLRDLVHDTQQDMVTARERPDELAVRLEAALIKLEAMERLLDPE